MYILDVMNNVTSDFIKPLNWHFKHFTYSRCHFSSDLYIPFVQFDTEGAHFMIMADVTTAEEIQDQIKTLSAELSMCMEGRSSNICHEGVVNAASDNGGGLALALCTAGGPVN